MSLKANAVTCQTSGNMVYVRNVRGELIETFSFPNNPLAQSFGNGISVICGTMCYTYMLKDGHLKQVGLHAV